MPGKRTNTNTPAYTKRTPNLGANTIEECDEALRRSDLTRTEQNAWLDARIEARHAADIDAMLEQADAA